MNSTTVEIGAQFRRKLYHRFREIVDMGSIREFVARGADRLTRWSRQVYAILDEVFLAGEIEETSKQVVLTRLEHLDKLE